jgi:hypothetical protein
MRGRAEAGRVLRRTAALAVVLVAVSSCPALAADFDKTVPVARGTRLQVRLFGGEVDIRAWDRDAVRVRATHYSSDLIEMRSDDGSVRLSARSLQGSPHAIDFTIDIPAWMAVDAAGTYVDLSVDGIRAAVTAETIRGDVRVRGGVGSIALKSIDGDVVLEGGEGRAVLSSAGGAVRVSGLRGDLLVDTVSGPVKLAGLASPSAEVTTVGGDISWDGSMAPAARYRFATHGGDIDVTMGDRANLTVGIRPFGGHVRALAPIALPDEAATAKRFTMVLGTGAARLDLETFSGTISLRPQAH